MIIDRKEVELNNYQGDLEFRKKDVVINVIGNVKINEIINNECLNIVFNIADNSSLVYNRFGLNIANNTKLVFNQNNNSTLYYKDAFIANEKTVLTIENNINGNNNISDIVVRGISKNAIVRVDATGSVLDGTFNNELKEDLRGLETISNSITIVPNLKVASSEVVANHNTTIGNINEDYLFYLNSKGLSKKKAESLLLDAFICGIYSDLEYQNKVKKILN